MSAVVRVLTANDRAQWDVLYSGYAGFFGVVQTEAMRDAVWDWLMDAGVEVSGLCAVQDARLVGIAHFRPYRRPLSASVGGFLDDLFVDPAARGGGVAEALIAAVRAEGMARGWTVIRWITAEDNMRARGLYDRVAVQTPWVTYDIRL